jgi:hypothetical protein
VPPDRPDPRRLRELTTSIRTEGLREATLDRLGEGLIGPLCSADRGPALRSVAVDDLDQADRDEATRSITPHRNDIHRAIVGLLTEPERAAGFVGASTASSRRLSFARAGVSDVIVRATIGPSVGSTHLARNGQG